MSQTPATRIGEQAVIFLHLRKTAGVTLHQILYRQYPKGATYHIVAPLQVTVPTFQRLPESERQRIRLLLGHVEYGIHEFLPQPTTYVTLVRDPLDRVVSLYYWISRNQGHDIHEAVAGRMSLKEFVMSGLSLQTDNGMVRALSGIPSRQVPFGETSTGMLDSALRNIASAFSVVGTTERFDESMMLMHHTLGWKRLPLYVQRNVTGGRPVVDSLTPEERSTIEELNQLDRALYSEIDRLFKDRVRELGREFDRDLTRFRRANSAYGQAYRASAPVRYVRRKVSTVGRGRAG